MVRSGGGRWLVCGAFGALALAGCDGVTTGRQPLTAGGPPPSTVVQGSAQPAPDAGAADASAPAEVDGGQTLCQHYCEALEQTNTYYCLGRGGDLDSCRSQFAGWAATCEQNRCPTGKIDGALCLKQCASLDAFYRTYCAAEAPTADGPCPSPPADHDAACRAGCSRAP